MPREQVEIRRVWHDVTRYGKPFFIIIARRKDWQMVSITTFSEWMASLCEESKHKELTLEWRRSDDGRGNELIDVEPVKVAV